jgi:FKBP-type peptidyl-prolyl cis-trans isomerase
MMKPLILAALLALAACNKAENPTSSAAPPPPSPQSRVVEEAPMLLASGVEVHFQRRAANDALATPGPDASVTVHYEGSLVSNGSVFDSSFQRGEPAEFPLNGVVRGFSEAISQMRPGDEVITTFPAELGYGAAGRPPAIPPNSALRFRIVLISYVGGDGIKVGP